MRAGAGEPGEPIPGPLSPDLVCEVDTDVGSLYAHEGDAVLAPALRQDGRWEPQESDFLRATLRRGDTFLDVGANIGYLTLLGAAAVGPEGTVLAIEPEPRNVSLLRANIWRNGARATVLPLAAFSRTGFIPLVFSPSHPGDH